ncbi:MAG: radical SAM protein [Candidatus Hodarchaeota archaeon]
MFVIWDLTQKCQLRCKYCYSSSTATSSIQELTTDEITDLVFPQFDEIGVDAICLSGGEPLIRYDDLLQIIRICNSKRYKLIVIATNGILLTEEKLDAIIKASPKIGDLVFALPLDTLDSDLYNEIRPGPVNTFEKVMQAYELCKKRKIWVSLEAVITQKNFHRYKELTDFAKQYKYAFTEHYPVYPAGRAREEGNQDLFLTETQLREFDQHQLESVGCPAIYWDIMPFIANPNQWQRVKVDAQRMYFSEGCPSIQDYFNLDADGSVMPCSFLRIPLGNIRETPLRKIFANHELAIAIRERKVKGKCTTCKYSRICGGCRARAFMETGDPLGEIPSCQATPEGHPLEAIFTKNLVASVRRMKLLLGARGVWRRLRR